MTALASAQAAFERPPTEAPMVTCPDCDGAGEHTECANDGTHGCSHTHDRTWSCDTCEGTGEIFAEDHPSWCDRCGLTGCCPDCDPRDPDEM